MIRFLAAAAGLSLLILAAPALAQSPAPAWGQPIYLDGWGQRVGGSSLSEVETRSYVETGRWADGTHERPYVYVPRRGSTYEDGYSYRQRGRGYGSSGYDRRPYQGYRDAWGYNDDRARPGRQGYVDRRGGGDCDCPDVYLYDR